MRDDGGATWVWLLEGRMKRVLGWLQGRRTATGDLDSTPPRASATLSGESAVKQVTEWSRPAPIYEYRVAGPAGALLHVERKVSDRPGLVAAVGRWLEGHQLPLEEFVYSPCPGGIADVEVVASGSKAEVLCALREISGPGSIFESPDPDLRLPEARHAARCTLYIPEGILVHSILIPVGEAAFRPGVEDCDGLPYANITHLVVERSPYALGVPGYYVDVFLTADTGCVLDAVIARFDQIREPLGNADSWILRTWPCACPSCAEPAIR